MLEKNHNLEPEEIEESDDPQVAELVAYLDGELPDEDADRVEQMLLSDPPLRKNAETLDRTWQLLDSLEEATVSGEFTQKTLASISTVSSETDRESLTALRRWRLNLPSTSVLVRGLIWFLAGFIACSAGLLLSRSARRERTDPAEARILKDLDLYREYPKLWRIPDADFLREVTQSPEPEAVNGASP